MNVLRISDSNSTQGAVVGRAPSPARRPRVRVLYVCRAIAHFIYHESVIVALLRRGAEVKVVFDEGWSSKKSIQFQDEALDAFRMRYPQVEIGWSVRRADRWRSWIFPAREIRSYANYLRRGPRTTEFYVNRWLGYVPQWVRKWRKDPFFRRLLISSSTDAALRAFERMVPAASGVIEHLKEESPDIVVVSPSNMRFSEEVEYVKAAKRLGILVALHTMTWDNLSTKGVHHIVPDLIFLWNEIHFDDIREFHGFPENICRIVGSPFLERWFDDEDPEDRASLCSRMGISAENHYILYLGSSKNIAKDEAWVVEKIHAQLRGSNDFRLRRMSIVIRPHPANVDVFQRLKLDNVVTWPLGGALPQTADLHREFGGMLTHATATIGINTTAMSDALLADRPCLTPLLPEYDRTQRLANHFKVLADRDVMSVCLDWRDVERNLSEILDGIDVTRHRRRGFKAWFARSLGTDRAAGDVVAERILEMEELGGRTKERAEPLGGAAVWMANCLHSARSEEVFRNYLDARDIACAMFDEAGAPPNAVSIWMDASALTVTRLRAVLGAALGDDPAIYESGDPGHECAVRTLHTTLESLDQHGLWQGEPPGLGLYGYSSDAGPLNLTGAMIRYAMLALRHSGLLGDFLKDKKRTAAFVGAGWGGTALAFASRFPKATVLVLDEPEGLVRAATYLRTVAPSLKIATATRSSLPAVLRGLSKLNVVLVPYYLADGLNETPIDLAVMDAVSGACDPAEAARVLEKLEMRESNRVCAVLNRGLTARRLAETTQFGSSEQESLVDWPLWLNELEESGGDPEPVDALGRLAHMVVRR